MPSNVAAVVARKLRRVAAEVERADVAAVRGGALAMTTSIRDEIARAVPSGRLSGMRGARVGARFDVVGSSATVKATGPLHIVERDTKAHEVKPKSARRRGGGKRAISFAGIARASAQHPGTKGKHPFARGVERGRDRTVRAMRDPITAAVTRGLRS